jgi:hypothetical protein
MRTPYEDRLAEATISQRKLLQGAATLCSVTNFSKCCRALWPYKTAEHLAAAAGCSIRAAAYQISGEQEPSLRSAQAVFNKMLERE